MSQESVPNGKGKSSNRPQYMTVGSGSTSESAARLKALLDNDSGYEGSMAGDNAGVPRWNPTLTEDRPTPQHSPMPKGPPAKLRRMRDGYKQQPYINYGTINTG